MFAGQSSRSSPTPGLDRRRLVLLGVSAAVAGAARPAPAQPAKDGAQLTALLDAVMQQALQNSPQLLTITGLDSGANAAAKSQLDDRSEAGLARDRRLFERFAGELKAFPVKDLHGLDLVNYRCADQLAATTLESYRFDYGDPGVGGAVPYVVSQLSGNYRNIPSFLASQHNIAAREDAEAYLSRLRAFARSLDQETERTRQHYARGATPPDFVLRVAETQFAAMLVADPRRSELVASLAQRTTAKGLSGDWEARAARIVQDEVFPALSRQLAVLRAALPAASHEAGCWRLPDGEAYYRFAVRSNTTTDMAGDEIHRLGLELVADLTAQADAILRAQGMSQGTVAQRLAAVRRRPEQHFPNTDAGREQLLAHLNAVAADMRTRLPAWFGALPKAPVEIQRAPVSIEAGAPGGYYQPPSVDGSRPGIFFINLRNLDEHARLDLPTLVFHEVLPGHHLQNTLSLEAPALPLLRRMPLFSAYSEGWALYAEQLADEMGVYHADPLGRLGYLASLLFRACRLVVDSGLHHKRWSREASIRYMVETLGDAESSVTREVERYCVQPGQASAYMLGQQVFLRSRADAQAKLGARFDIRRFHDAALLAGAMPLDVLEQHLAGWAAGEAESV